MTYTVGTLFSGIGVPDLCARLLGMETVWQVEKEAFPQAVLRKNFPEAVLHGDIFDCHDLPYVDVVVAGFPCQPFSVAGKQEGDRDPRYLVPEMLRVIDETRPRICLLENVPGFASLDDGKSFKSLLGALAEMGLDAEWGHIRASDVGAPHVRERWWLVGYSTSTDAGRAYQGGRASFQPRRNGGRGRGDDLGNTDCQRRQEREAATFKPGMGFTGGRYGTAEPENAGQPQPRLGRVIDGVANWMDGFIGYPAAPNRQQYADELPRVSASPAQRDARLKALGNSMAVDVVFEIMRAIKLWLEAEDGAA